MDNLSSSQLFQESLNSTNSSIKLPKAFINTNIPETPTIPFVEIESITKTPSPNTDTINDLIQEIDLDKIFKCGIIIGFVLNTYLFLLKSIKLYNKQVSRQELIDGYFKKIEYGYILLLILLLCIIM
jgi:hypothetical protein